ncbi:MAG: hypothetical protein J1F66_05450 [Clostridiales bacterium]|nr:hypothetical protein [Clostridiales bacterium]
MKKSLSVILFIVFVLTCTTALIACHQHTYDEEKWESDDTYHWHPTICEHSDVVNKEEHDINEFNRCIICGWQGKLPYNRVSSEIWEATFENFYNLRNFTITYSQFYEGETTFTRLVEVTGTAIHWLQIKDGNREETYAKVDGGVATVCEFNDGVWSATAETFDYDEWVVEQLDALDIDYFYKITESFEKFFFSDETGGTYTFSGGTFAGGYWIHTKNVRFIGDLLYYFAHELTYSLEYNGTSEFSSTAILDKIGTTNLEILF